MRQRQVARMAPLVVIFGALSIGLLTRVSETLAGPSAREIMEKVTQARKLDGSEAVVKMIIVSANGEKRERSISMATKLYDGGDTEKRLYRFLSPPDVKGTGILVYDYAAKPDDIWIYLPALRKTRRIVSSERSKSFMGSDFSYGDLNIPALDEFNYTLIKEEAAGGEKCWVIDVVPKDKATAESDGYEKKTYWVSEKTYAVRKGVYFGLGGKPFKELTTDDIKLLDPKKHRYRAMHMEMNNKETGRHSIFESVKVEFTPSTKDDYFTTRYLERE